MKVKKTTVSPDDLAYPHLSNVDYSDAYACDFECPHKITADDFQITFWTDYPAVVVTLFKLRDWLVKPFGIQTGSASEKDKEDFIACIRQEGKTRLFRVVGKSGNETMISGDDKHLKAFLSAKVTELNANNKNIKVTTLVKFHNTLGRLYFVVIYPFHHLIVKTMVRHAIGKLTRQTPPDK
jgi:hypothetical protein